MPKTSRVFLAIFLGPAFVLFTVFVAIPSVRALLYSLQHWDGLTEPRWVGLDNFRQLIQDSPLFFDALSNNILLIVCSGTVTITLALIFAAMIHRKVGGASVYRVTFFFPNVIASVAVALLWVLLYSVTDFGFFNGLLIGLHDGLERVGIVQGEWALPFPFLASKYLIYSIVPMVVWAA